MIKYNKKLFIPRTSIRVKLPDTTKGKGAVDDDVKWIDIGSTSETDDPKYMYCQWKNAHGNDVLLSNQEFGLEKATIKMIYDDRITSECRIYKYNPTTNEYDKEYEVIGFPDDILDRHQLLEIYLKRVVQS